MFIHGVFYDRNAGWKPRGAPA